jgi:hypothetical protein
MYNEFDEYMDHDAISCSRGDFNTWEENQIMLDEFYDRYAEDELDALDEREALYALDDPDPIESDLWD